MASTFVLVHGAWHGGWCWRRVADRLQAAGHRVFCPTLTGLGERAHLLTREVGLDTHIADVIALLEAEELTDVVLVGHSYAGTVITGVADAAKTRLRKLVYVDAAIVEDGECWSSHAIPEVAAQRRRLARETSDGLSMPVPDAAVFGIPDAADRAWVQRRLTPHPFKPFDQVMRWRNPIGNGLPRLYIDCVDPVYANLSAVKAKFRGQPGWPFVELKAGHDAMVSAPEALTRILLEAA